MLEYGAGADELFSAQQEPTCSLQVQALGYPGIIYCYKISRVLAQNPVTSGPKKTL